MDSNKRIHELLNKLNIPNIEIHVCGNVVGVKCQGHKTAQKWHSILSKFTDSRITEISIPKKTGDSDWYMKSAYKKGYAVGGILK